MTERAMKLLPLASAVLGPAVAAVVASPGVPFPVLLAVVLAGPATYVIVCGLLFLLYWKALDVVNGASVADLMTTLTDQPVDSTRRRR